jgi:hypothetical protein
MFSRSRSRTPIDHKRQGFPPPAATRAVARSGSAATSVMPNDGQIDFQIQNFPRPMDKPLRNPTRSVCGSDSELPRNAADVRAAASEAEATISGDQLPCPGWLVSANPASAGQIAARRLRAPGCHIIAARRAGPVQCPLRQPRGDLSWRVSASAEIPASMRRRRPAGVTPTGVRITGFVAAVLSACQNKS